MSSASIGERRPHVAAAADGALLTAGAFALFTGVLGLLVWFGVAEPAGSESGSFLARALGAGLVLIGQGLAMITPPAVWILRGHPLSTRTVLALLGGLLGTAIVGGLVAMSLPLVAGLIGPLVGGDIAALLTVGAAVGILFVAGACFTLVDAAQDLVAPPQAHRLLDMVRIAAAAVMVPFAIGGVVAMQINPAGEVGEAFAFLLLAGVLGGLFVAATDASDMWLSTHPRGEHFMADA